MSDDLIIKTDGDKVAEAIQALTRSIDFQNRLIEEGVVHFITEFKKMMAANDAEN